jgi:DNA repair protein RecO (recombination protein O)
VKYGDTSLITTIFTADTGVQTYIVQGVRNSKAKQAKAGLLQPATLLDIVTYHKPQTNLQRLREFQLSYIYTTLQEEVIKNSIALFSVEVLLKLLPEHAPMPDLFQHAFDYFCQLDRNPIDSVANYPLFFVITCGRVLGYDIHGSYSAETPYLNMREGAFTNAAPGLENYLNDEDALILSQLIAINDVSGLNMLEMNSATRNRLLDWYLEFLHSHTQHMGSIKSLGVLRTILH